MGYNTVVLVMNDALDMIRADAEFGQNLARAVVMSSSRREKKDIPAHKGNSVYVNAATVLSSAHADVPQILIVKRNYGYELWKEMSEDHLQDLKTLLNHHGYAVRKKARKTK